jgi:pyridoxine kinase
MNILSIQSEVVFGHVGQGAARFALQRLGHEVWALPTVLYSNHAGYDEVTGETLSDDLLRRLLKGLEVNGWLAKCDAVLSGYLGSAEQAEFVAEAVCHVKQANPKALYCLDPVMGDNGRAYVKPGVAEATARCLLPLADIVTPNTFELVQLSALSITDQKDARVAAARLGRRMVFATSVPEGADRIGVLGVSAGQSPFVTTPLLRDVPHGAGDLITALLLSECLREAPFADALRRSVARVFHILAASRGAGELRLVEEQDMLVAAPDFSGLQLSQAG